MALQTLDQAGELRPIETIGISPSLLASVSESALKYALVDALDRARPGRDRKAGFTNKLKG